MGGSKRRARAFEAKAELCERVSPPTALSLSAVGLGVSPRDGDLMSVVANAFRWGNRMA